MLSKGNQNIIPTFILLCFLEYPEPQVPIFLVFLSIYTVTVLGSLGMVVIIKINSKLHMIMCFFLSHLSFGDFHYSIIVTPKFLENLIVETEPSPFPGPLCNFVLLTYLE